MTPTPPISGTVYTNPRGRRYVVVSVDGDRATVSTTCARPVVLSVDGRRARFKLEEYEQTDTLRWRIAVPENGWSRQNPEGE